MYSNSDKKTRKKRILTKEHKEKISLAHLGKKKNCSFPNRKRISITPTWVRKPVVCVNTEERFNSLVEAAEELYKNKHSANEISEVCRGIKKHYKKHVWKYEEEYLSLSESEKAILKKKCIELNKLFIKYRTKLFFDGQIYDSPADLGEKLFKENLLSYGNNTRVDLSKLLSTMIGFAKKKHCPFILLENHYIFWSEYEVLCKDKLGAHKISEKPIDKPVEEIYNCYINYLDKVIGDITVSELLQSYKTIFYKLDNLYFKCKDNIKKLAYDDVIDKKTLIYLKYNSNYKFLFNIETYNLTNTSKNKFYMKNDYIFLNKQDYINRFIKCVTKEKIIKELNILD